MNLLEETLAALEENGKTPDDIMFIGDEDGEYGCTWEEFKVLANKEYTYDPEAEFDEEMAATGMAFGFSPLASDKFNTGDDPDDLNGDEEEVDMVAMDLMIKFKDHSTMYRREDTGMYTGWNFQPVFKPADNLKPIKALIGGIKPPFGATIRSLNAPKVQMEVEQHDIHPASQSVN